MGFHIQESVRLYCSTIKISAFTKGKGSWVALKWSKLDEFQMSEFMWRGLLGKIGKKYSILGATQPIHFVTIGNGEVTTPAKIAKSCCALANLCDSVVPFD